MKYIIFFLLIFGFAYGKECRSLFTHYQFDNGIIKVSVPIGNTDVYEIYKNGILLKIIK